MTDWKRIEQEYMEGASYRALGEKYGISRETVASRGKRGGWVEKRDKFTALTGENLLPERARRLMEVGDTLLRRVEELGQEASVTPAGLKTLSETLKNIRDTQMIRSARDMQEQQARIEKLRRESDRSETGGGSVTVRLEASAGELAG